MKSSSLGLVALVTFGLLGPAQGQSPATGDPRPTPPSSTSQPARQGPAGWFRLDASVGIFPIAGRMKYSFVYRDVVLDNKSGTPRPSPAVSLSAAAQRRWFFLGFSLQLTTLKWIYTEGGTGGYDGRGYEVDFLPRIGLALPLISSLRLLLSGAPGYSIVDVSGMTLGAYTRPSTLQGFVVQGDVGLLFFFTRRGFAQAGASTQWGFQNDTVTSKTSNQAATAELRTLLFGFHVGVGYWF